MTADELREKVREDLLRIARQKPAMLVTPGEMGELADAAIRVVIEAAMATAKQHIGSAARYRRQRGQTFNTLPDHEVAEIQAEERGEDIAADIIRRELTNLLPEEQQ